MTYINVNDIEQMIEDENISTIVLDFDGVIAQSVKSILLMLNKKYNTNITPIEILSWNFSEVDKDITAKEIEGCFNSIEFWRELEFYDGIEKFMSNPNYADKIIICSKGGDLNIEHKRNWLSEKGFANIPLIGLPLNVSKGWMNMEYKGKSLFIDDSVVNLNESNSSVKILLKEFNNNADWQRNWTGYIMKGWE